MAAASTAFRLCSRAIARPRPAPALHARPLLQRRTLTSSPLRWRPAKNPGEEDPEAAESEEPSSDYNFVETMLADIPAKDRSPEMEVELEELRTQLENQESNMHDGLDEMSAKLFKEPRPQRDSFWFDEEDDDPTTQDIVGDEFDEDDIPTMAHGKLDEVREYRHYARIVAWEMPMLASMFPLVSGHLGVGQGGARMANTRQNSRNRSKPQRRTRSSATATRHTWANSTPHSARSS